MSQLTFDGIVDPSSAPEPKGVKPADQPESWYKGRVLSHSSIGMYRACPQRWKFRYIDKVPEKPKSFFSFGKSVHAGLEFLFEKLTEPLPSLEDLVSHYKTTWLSEGYETAAQEKWFYQEGERILRGFYAKHKNDFKNVFKVEYKFNISIDGVPITGYIDRIDTTSNGGLALLDYKTGKAFDKARVRSDSQVTLYQMAVQEVFQKPVESVTLYHLNSLTPLTVSAHSKTMEKNLREVIVDAAKGITEEKFEPKPDERGHCQWCDYMQICPAFSGRKLSTPSTVPANLVEKADRLGKLDAKIGELMLERAELQNDLGATMRVSGQEEVKGKHFLVKREGTADGIVDRLITGPAENRGE